jgi:spermidine/putrescine transport system substrate-binding protein
MEKINPTAAKNPLIFPNDKMWASLKVFRDLTPSEQTQFATAFQKASGNA